MELTDDERPVDPMRRLREVFPRTLVATWVGDPAGAAAGPPRAGGAGDRDTGASGAGRDESGLILDFLREAGGRPPTRQERDLVDRALAALRASA